jgi:hypothetical protein
MKHRPPFRWGNDELGEAVSRGDASRTAEAGGLRWCTTCKVATELHLIDVGIDYDKRLAGIVAEQCSTYDR